MEKPDEFFPVAQFLIPGFEKSICLDWSSSGGGIILYIREGIVVYQSIQKHF